MKNGDRIKMGIGGTEFAEYTEYNAYADCPDMQPYYVGLVKLLHGRISINQSSKSYDEVRDACEKDLRMISPEFEIVI